MISVIIPVYNAEKYLSILFEDLIEQKYTDFEVICIDDGSTDNSLNIIQTYQNKLDLKIFHQQNKGAAAARNSGIRLANGEYICFVDADDRLNSEYLLHLFEITKSGVDLGITQIKRTFEYKPSLLEKQFNYIQNNIFSLSTIDEHKDLLIHIRNAPYAKIISKEILEKNNISFLEDYKYEDMYFTLLLLMCNPKVISVNHEDYTYLVHKQSEMTKSGDHLYDIFSVYQKILDKAQEKNLFEKYFNELEFLAIYHICIGGLYRLFKYRPFHFIPDWLKCRRFLKTYHFSINNKYVKDMQFLVKLYLWILFW